MLLKRRVLDGIVAGSFCLAFRRWKRPTVKTGGTLRTVIGVLAIDSVDVVNEMDINERDAKLAGYESREQLLAELDIRKAGRIYRIALHHAGADPRHDLRQQGDLSDGEIDNLKIRLTRMDTRSSYGAWTTTTLRLIAENPGKRATDLAEAIGLETKRFKTNVRKLKELGLTESLKVGYRLSPRGVAIFERLRS